MIAQMGDFRDRYPADRQLAADGGLAPVAVESGKAKRAQFRWACDHRLREAFNVLAGPTPPPPSDGSAPPSPQAARSARARSACRPTDATPQPRS
jgi:transposase